MRVCCPSVEDLRGRYELRVANYRLRVVIVEDPDEVGGEWLSGAAISAVRYNLPARPGSKPLYDQIEFAGCGFHGGDDTPVKGQPVILNAVAAEIAQVGRLHPVAYGGKCRSCALLRPK